MMRTKALLVLGALALVGCSQTATEPGQAYGPTGAAVAGSAAASAVLAGGVIGNVAGRDLDQAARRKAQEAEYQALEFGKTGSPTTWQSGAYHGEVVPGPPYQVNAYDCRDYTHTIDGPGQPQRARATACRRANGTWQPVT
jgi:surface antigen